MLEAGTRVGGRTRDLDVGDDVVTEGGGQWIGVEHERMFALLDDLGLATFPTHTAGETLYLHRGRRRTFGGTIPPMRPWAMLDFAQAQPRLERMAQQAPVATPWTARRAIEWDGTTLGHWLDAHCHADESKHMFTFGFSLYPRSRTRPPPRRRVKVGPSARAPPSRASSHVRMGGDEGNRTLNPRLATMGERVD